MKPGPLLFRITGIDLGIQLLLGGLLTFGFISPGAHIVNGFILFFLAVATMIVWYVSKPAFRPLQVISTVIVLLLVLQIALGFATLSTGSNALAFAHFITALAIFGATLSGTFMSMRWAHMSETSRDGSRAAPA